MVSRQTWMAKDHVQVTGEPDKLRFQEDHWMRVMVLERGNGGNDGVFWCKECRIKKFGGHSSAYCQLEWVLFVVVVAMNVV